MPKHVIDMIIVEGEISDTFTVSSGANKNVSLLCGEPVVPTGYIGLFSWYETEGDASVVSTGFRNRYVHNTKNSTSYSLTCHKYTLCVKYG